MKKTLLLYVNHLTTDRTGLHSVLLPLFIVYSLPNQFSYYVWRSRAGLSANERKGRMYKLMTKLINLLVTETFLLLFYYTIIKLIRALWLVNQLWFIVP